MDQKGYFREWTASVKKMIIWGVAHWIASLVVFIPLYLIVPGFPYFPKTVYKTTQQESTTQLEPGGYYLMFYVEGDQKLATHRSEVGGVELKTARSGDTFEPIPLTESNYYFDDAPDRVGVRGHSVASFVLADAQKVKITADFQRYRYDGLLIRTGFRKLLLAIAGYQLIALLLSITMVRIYWKRSVGRIAQTNYIQTEVL